MKTLFITSAADAAGKNMLMLGLGSQMQQDKYRVGFFKPIGNKPIRHERILTDEDIVFFHQSLGLNESVNNLCPLVLSDEITEEVISGKSMPQPVMDLNGKIAKLMERISQDKDVMLVKGLGRFYRGAMFGLTESNLIKDFNWKTILVDGYRAGRLALPIDTLDGFITAKKLFGNLLIGVVINNVPDSQLDYLKKKVVPYLRDRHQIDVLGIIPQTDALRAVSVKELCQALGGEIICAKDKEDTLVERFCMSTMNVENDLRYFRQEKCKAVVCSGDRTDIHLAALETPTQCLVLTGRLYPADIILSKAEEQGVPVIVVRDDTLKTMGKIDRLSKHLGVFTPSKVNAAIKIVKQHVNIKAIYKRI
ncbi:MAG: phosphotransacetylase family protein [Candidatus Brocadiia bacterium]